MKKTSVFIPDAEAVARAPRNLTIRAMPDCAIVWFLPYRRGQGVIEIPEKHQEQSVEALVIDDSTGYGLVAGTKVLVSRLKGEGEYFDLVSAQQDPYEPPVRLCRVRREGLILIDESEAA